MPSSSSQRIRDLNDAFRRTFNGGRVLVTAGVTALADDDKAIVLTKVRGFTAFDRDNNPHGEHDFGIIEHAGESYMWKIDYYDLTCEAGSENPADPAITTRVLTIMRADEY
jgi:hypothetical protein